MRNESLVIAILVAIPATAQASPDAVSTSAAEEENPESEERWPAPPKGQPSSVGAFGGYMGAMGPIDGRLRLWGEAHVGGEIGRWSFGMALGWSGGRRRTRLPDGSPRNMSATYAGPRVAYALVHRHRLDIGIEGVVAGGQICFDDGRKDAHGHVVCSERRAMLLTSPRVFLNVRTIRAVKIGIVAGYRFVNRRPLWPGENLQFAGPFVAFTVALGAWA